MMSDLFTIFDYTWGSGFTFLSLTMWFSGFLLPIFVISFMVYWYSPNYMDSAFMGFVNGFGVKVPEEVKWMGGTSHLFVTLLFVLLMFNISGTLPYHYPLSSHFFVIGGFAFSFWFATVFLNFSPNWRLLFVNMVQEGGYLVPNAMVIFSEVISFLARPVTLMCRLAMNIIIGQIITSLIGNVCVGLFFPFFWYSSSVTFESLSSPLELYYFCSNFIFSFFFPYVFFLIKQSMILFAAIFMFLVELAVSFLQACIFTGLLVFYVYEVPFKLKEDMTSYKSVIS
uniref:ATP synthase subunit a n=1 Tax=Cyclina sinensis TaxID=120566 RepID=A0A125S9U2_CYCSN|nr:ATP synthase F0 subunit 6 [Cyclina sinensis]